MARTPSLKLERLEYPEHYKTHVFAPGPQPIETEADRIHVHALLKELRDQFEENSKTFLQSVQDTKKRLFSVPSLSEQFVDNIKANHDAMLKSIKKTMPRMAFCETMLPAEFLGFLTHSPEWRSAMNKMQEANAMLEILSDGNTISAGRKKERGVQIKAVNDFREARLQEVADQLQLLRSIATTFRSTKFAFNPQAQKDEGWKALSPFLDHWNKGQEKDRKQMKAFRGELQPDVLADLENAQHPLAVEYEAVKDQAFPYVETMLQLLDFKPSNPDVELWLHVDILRECLPKPYTVHPKLPLADAGHPWSQLADGHCTICMDTFTDLTCIVGCEHVFCLECVATWVYNEHSCPTCRKKAKLDDLRRIVVTSMGV